ncbi:unnamed protein product, partial [Mesorhabditis spiculigera]
MAAHAFGLDTITQAPNMKTAVVRKIARNAWGITNCKIQVLNGYEDQNFRLTDCVWDSGSTIDQTVIMKVTNPVAALNPEHLDFQRRICELLNAEGIPAPYYIPLKGSQKIWRLEKVAEHMAPLPVRMIRVLPGNSLDQFEANEAVVVAIGRIVARFHNIMDQIPVHERQGHVPFIAAENVECAVTELQELENRRILSPERAQMVRVVFDELRMMLDNGMEMDRGLIHSDINDTNILVQPAVDGSLEITALIDMGDVHTSLRVMDMGATCLYLALSDKAENGDWRRFPTWFLEGYESVRPCPDAHRIYSAMRARMACSLVCGLRANRINARHETDSYVLKTQKKGWKMLELLLEAEPKLI